MSQWDIINHPTANSAVSVRLHPRTGEKLTPIGVFRGRVVWPIMGAADGDDNGNAGDNNATGQNDDQGGASGQQTGSEGQQNQGQTDGGSGDNQGSAERTYTQADWDQLMSRMQAADRRASNFETELKKVTDAGKSEQQRKEDEAAAAIKERDELKQEVRNARIGNAFLTVTGYNWHNPSDALDMLMARYLDGVEVDDDGKVTGIDAAVKKMAKDKSYLIKTETSSTAQDQMNGKRKGEGNDADQKTRDAELLKRFPSMQRGVRS